METSAEDSTRSAVPWALVGVLWALTVLGLASIGWYIAPIALLATAIVSRREGRRGTAGTALGALVLAAVLLAAALATN